jgi:enoyl-CoA hydratase/carnithine racemase
MLYRTIRYVKKGHVATIRLKRSSVGKFISPEFVHELGEVSDHINDDDSVYVVILTGTGAAFVDFGDGKPGERPPPGAAAAIAAIEQPIITAINGDAFGIGLEMALSCDIRIASDKARFALPQVTQACIPADGATQRLPRIIGRGKALEMLLTAATLSASEALEIGLVNKVVPPGELANEAQKLAETITAKGPLALKYLKEAVTKGMDLTLTQGLRLEADLYFLLHTTADRTEGITAFREKRKPQFRGK